MVKSIYINKMPADLEMIKNVIQGFNNDQHITAHGGFLFKCSLLAEEFHFGYTPWFLDQKRCFHFEIPMLVVDDGALIGNMIPGGLITILFHPKSRPVNALDLDYFRSNCRALAGFLLNNGYTNTGILDEVTRSMFISIGIHDPVPEKLEGLIVI